MKHTAMRKLLAVVAIALLPAAALAQHSVTLTWTQSTSPVVNYNTLYRGATSSGPWTKLFTSITPTTLYLDTTVLASKTYYYVVTASCDTCSPLESVFSNISNAAVIPADPQPPAPTGLAASSIK